MNINVFSEETSNIFSLGSPINNGWAMIRYGENQLEAIGRRGEEGSSLREVGG